MTIDLEAFKKKIGNESWLIPHSDQYQGEYLNPRDERLAALTGFTGSAGMAVVTKTAQALAVDSRYTLQAKQQSGDRFEIINLSLDDIAQWISAHHVGDDPLCIDPWLVSVSQFNTLQSKLAPYAIRLTAKKDNPVDALWQNRPEAKNQNWKQHDLQYAGKPSCDKISDITQVLQKHGCDNYLITACDNISWLLNVRANRVPFTPVVQAFALLSQGDVTIFSDDTVDPKLLDVAWFPLHDLPKKLQELNENVGYDPTTTPVHLLQYIAKSVSLSDPITREKAIKNPTEIAGARNAHYRDGRALSSFIFWLKKNYHNLDEYRVGVKLQEQRKMQDLYQEDSFSTIAGFKSNGAIVHYRAESHGSQKLSDGPLLIDSGAQYLDGTTDVTRTIWLGEGQPDSEFRNRYTLVLKGHIHLAMVIFPKGTSGAQLDVLARQFLWQHGCDYGHGTGHGVGSYLSVHEGPQGISPRAFNTALQPGMILSNEPGYYVEGQYGIRHENLVLVCQHPTFKDFLYFETLTCVPFDEKCIETSLLTSTELQWLNAYHAHVENILNIS